MKAKDYLKQIRKTKIRIDENADTVEELTAFAEKVTSVLSGDVVSRTRNNDTMTETVNEIIELKNAIEKDAGFLVDLIREAEYLLPMLENPSHFKVLHSRYVLFKKWEQIADELGVSYQWVCGDLHGRALQEFQKILDNYEKNSLT